MVATEELVLVDLNAGSGYEADGEKVAALQILETFQEAENARENEAKTLQLFLSDASKTNLEKLKQNLQNVSEEGEITPQLPENINLLNEPETAKTLLGLLQKVPGLVVADPFSYAQAQEILAQTLTEKNDDLFVLFDYKKLEKTFLAENPTVFLAQLFGEALPEIKAKFQLQQSPKRKEQLLLEQLENAFQEQEFYPLSFKINPPGKAGNAVYLFLAGKSIAHYFRAKEWLQTFSEFQEDGVPLFGVNLNYQPAAIPGFSNFLNKFSLENLTQELAGKKADFHYQTIREIYETHSFGTNYILANYVAAFRQLQKAEKVNLVDASNKKVLKITPEAVVFYRLHNK
ncbi:three-Cys-motif partner protein TcmP [Adhaeribacter terreus]